MTSALQELSAEMADVAEGVRQSLVQIRNGRRGGDAGSIWHSDGLILTNAHVVGSSALQVTLPDGRDLPGRVLAHDSGLDLAVGRLGRGHGRRGDRHGAARPGDAPV